jgi:hypothetical protein
MIDSVDYIFAGIAVAAFAAVAWFPVLEVRAG